VLARQQGTKSGTILVNSLFCVGQYKSSKSGTVPDVLGQLAL